MEKEAKDTAKERENRAGMVRMGKARVERAIINDDKKRGSKK
jgi:hypothetical protein